VALARTGDSAIVRYVSSLWYLAAAAVTCLVGAGLAIGFYGGASVVPGFFAGFGASLLAFVLALSWERDREHVRAKRDAANLESHRVTEARRRLETIKRELETNADSLEFLERSLPSPPGTFNMLHPQLLDGAWTASAARVTELIADYDLTGGLAYTYGRIEELRWRLRYRSEHGAPAQLERMTASLVMERRTEVRDLLSRVTQQIENPDVQPVGLAHYASVTMTGGGSLTATGSRGRPNESG
jgi:hypothetical protein